MMIDKIVIQNFQSHKRTILNLSPGVNVFVGSSDVGKTAILRAIRWLVWNRPSGDAFRSRWGGKTRVCIYTNDNRIQRIKGSKNQYILNDLEFEAMKTDVPDEIIQAINLNEINLQRQFDRPFLLDSSPGEVAQHFNVVSHLDKIDSSMKVVQSWLRQIEEDIANDSQQLNQLEDSLSDYDSVEQLDGQITALEILDYTKIQTAKNIRSLSQLIQDIENNTAAIDKYKHLLDLEKPVKEVLDLYAQSDGMEQEKLDLVNLIRSIQQAEDNISFHRKTLVVLEEEFKKEFPKECPLCGHIKNYEHNDRRKN